MLRWTLLIALVSGAVGCDDGDGETQTQADGGVVTDGGNAGSDSGAEPDSGHADSGSDASQGADAGIQDAGTDSGACRPVACLQDDCGPRPDGCGGIMECDLGCACEGEDCGCEFASDCAARPCETARCEAGACTYDPVACGEAVCECADDACDDSTPRPCGEGCDAQICDPSPDGEGGFLNRCVTIDALPCGACGISTSACDAETNTLICTDLIPVEAAQGKRCEQLVLFVDPTYDGPQRGTREAPYFDLAAALDLAALADVGFVIIGGSETLPGPVVLRDGIELRGGFSGHPFFQPSADRPTVRATGTPNAVADGQIVAVKALDVVNGAALRMLNLTVDAAPATPPGTSEDGTSGVHTIGLMAINSPALTVQEVTVTVGSASAGMPGADAVPVEANLDPALMNGPNGIDAPGPIGTGGCDDLWDEVWNAFPNGDGQPCGNANPLGPVIPGTRGAWGAVCPADLDGVRSQTNPGGAAGHLLTICHGVSPGSRPSWSEDQINRRAGTPGAVGGSLDALNRWRSAGVGGTGLPGIGGRPGAGGHSLGTDGCHFAAAGGGGGAGGCGGFGGRPGGAGGAAIGVLLIGSTGAQIVDVSATVADGGSGAAGGVGSNGLPGGQGGAPGLNEYGRESGAQAGEAGGAGHPGGPGGNGAGGDSAGIYCVDTLIAAPPEAFVVGAAGSGATAHGDRGAAPAPNGRAQPLLGCAP